MARWWSAIQEGSNSEPRHGITELPSQRWEVSRMWRDNGQLITVMERKLGGSVWWIFCANEADCDLCEVERVGEGNAVDEATVDGGDWGRGRD